MTITIGGLLLIAGILVLIVAIAMTFSNFGLATGLIILLVTTLVGAILLYQGYKTISSSNMALTTEIDGKVNELENIHFGAGTEGFAYTDLRPVGKAFINGSKYEVHSLSNFIKKDTPIIVHKIEVNKIIVKQLTKS